MPKANAVLIGMPGSGKSTLGVLLAKELGYDFIDADLEIQKQEGCLLQEIVNTKGTDEFRRIESRVCQGLSGEQLVIATGGSVVYSPEAMDALKQLGDLIWLNVSYPELEGRIKNFATRGLAKKPGQTLEDLFNERMPLYQKYAESKIDCDGKSPEVIVKEIAKQLTT